MTLLQAHDNQAFTELYARYKVALYSYLTGQLGSVLAEEIMQETFIKVINKKETFRFESKVKTWIWTIAKNTLRDHWRSSDHKMKYSFAPLTDEDSGEEIYQADLDNQEILLLDKITKHQLNECIKEMPPEQKEIVLLHVHSELSHQEIAELTQTSIGAIKSTLFRAKEKLTECFKRGGHL